jgi:hypothetical protein
MKLTFHIGHYKTGSTAIQTFFDANRDRYRRNGWLYPSSGRPAPEKPNHSGVAFQTLLEADQPVASWYTRTKEFERYQRGEVPPARALILDEIEQEQPDHVLLSSELFIRFADRTGVPVSQAKELVHSFSPEQFGVVCYLRRPDRYLESWYNQQVKLGNTPPRLADDLDYYINSVHVQYFDAVSYWTNLVGAERLTLLRYDDVGESLIERVVSGIGAPVFRNPKVLDPTRRANPRVPDAFVEFLRTYNRDRRRGRSKRLKRVLSTLGRTPEIAQTPVHFLDVAARRRLFETFQPIDRQLAALAGSGSTFFPDLEDMMTVAPYSISDQEAFDRWAFMALEALRDDLDASGAVSRSWSED